MDAHSFDVYMYVYNVGLVVVSFKPFLCVDIFFPDGLFHLCFFSSQQVNFGIMLMIESMRA